MKLQTPGKFTLPIFFIVGLSLTAGGINSAVDTRDFIAVAARADGEVVRLERRMGSDDSSTYYPVVRFQSPNRQEAIEFESGSGSNPPAFEEGEVVAVLYHPEYPRNAKIDSFFQLWGLAVILGGIGIVFVIIPVGSWFFSMRRKKRAAYLRMHGQRVDTAFLRGEIDTSLKINGRHGWRVLTEGKDPTTGSMRTFQSDRVWTDPGAVLKPGQTILVYLDPEDKQKYFVDLSSAGLL